LAFRADQLIAVPLCPPEKNLLSFSLAWLNRLFLPDYRW
jgi:hypothetical protein